MYAIFLEPLHISGIYKWRMRPNRLDFVVDDFKSQFSRSGSIDAWFVVVWSAWFTTWIVSIGRTGAFNTPAFDETSKNGTASRLSANPPLIDWPSSASEEFVEFIRIKWRSAVAHCIDSETKVVPKIRCLSIAAIGLSVSKATMKKRFSIKSRWKKNLKKKFRIFLN